MPFRVAGGETSAVRVNPDLQEMQRLIRGGIELAVSDTLAGAHQLDLAGLELAAVAHAVLVGESSFEDIAEDLHVAMGMGPKAVPGIDAIVVDHPERTEPRVRGVVVIGKGKGVMRFKPAMIGIAALVGSSEGQLSCGRFHGATLAAAGSPGQCQVIGLRLPLGYGARHGTPAITVFRGGG